MKRSNTLTFAVLAIFVSFTEIVAAASDQGAAEVEAVVKQYLHYFDTKNYAGMESLTTPELVVVDYGQRFNRADWNWYMRMDEEVEIIGADQKKEAAIDPIVTSNFDTKVISNEVAYTNFDQAWTSNPKFVEPSIMVLRRIDGKWLIDRWTIHEGEVWYKWLRDRIRAKGGKVEANWYELYKKERAAAVEPKYN